MDLPISMFFLVFIIPNIYSNINIQNRKLVIELLNMLPNNWIISHVYKNVFNKMGITCIILSRIKTSLFW